MKSDWSAIGRTGGSVGPAYGVNWTYGSTLASGRSITDSGTYPSGGLETLVSSGGRVWGETDVFSINSPSINFNWTSGYQSVTGAPAQSITQSDSLAQAMADPGPDAPEEAKDGQAQGWGAWLWDTAKAAVYDSTIGIPGRINAALDTAAKDNREEWDGYGSKFDKLTADFLRPDSRMTVNQLRGGAITIVKGQAANVANDALTMADGVMAVGDAVGVVKLTGTLATAGISAGKGVAARATYGRRVAAANAELNILDTACFGEGTRIKTPEGERRVETFHNGVRILARPEDDPTGEVRICMVDAVFVFTARIWELHVGGKIIETTVEHPFFVLGRDQSETPGWTPLNCLSPGDLLLGDGQVPMAVERVVETDRTATVYNLRVEPDHTFFVGGDDWGFSLWVHNTRTCSATLRDDLIDAGRPSPGAGYQVAHIVPYSDFAASNRPKAVIDAIKKSRNALFKARGHIDAIDNLFWAKSGHNGTHSNEFYLYLWKNVLKPAVRTGTVQDALKKLGQDLEAGVFSFLSS